MAVLEQTLHRELNTPSGRVCEKFRDTSFAPLINAYLHHCKSETDQYWVRGRQQNNEK